MRSADEREKLHREAARRWDRLARAHPELSETIAAGRGLVALYIDHLPPTPPLALTPDAAREKLAAGVPLLADEALNFDLPALRQFFAILCTWAAEQPANAEVGEQLGRMVASGEFDLEAFLAAALAADEATLAESARRFAIPATLVQRLAGFLTSAALIGAARELAPLLAGADPAWGGVDCPICGGSPLLAELWGTEGQRALRCGTCGTGWRYARNRCAGCGSDDLGAQHYLAAEGQEEKYRVDLCEHCRHYLKSCTNFAPTPPELLAIEDIALLYLAEEARRRGYTPIGLAS